MRYKRLFDLPADMRDPIGDIVDDWARSDKDADFNARLFDSNPEIKVKRIPVRSFPKVPISGRSRDDRGGIAHAVRMRGKDLPPVLVGGESWFDGRHRVWIARKDGRISIPAIDLKEVGFKLGDDVGMGPINYAP